MTDKTQPKNFSIKPPHLVYSTSKTSVSKPLEISLDLAALIATQFGDYRNTLTAQDRPLINEIENFILSMAEYIELTGVKFRSVCTTQMNNRLVCSPHETWTTTLGETANAGRTPPHILTLDTENHIVVINTDTAVDMIYRMGGVADMQKTRLKLKALIEAANEQLVPVPFCDILDMILKLTHHQEGIMYKEMVNQYIQAAEKPLQKEMMSKVVHLGAFKFKCLNTPADIPDLINEAADYISATQASEQGDVDGTAHGILMNPLAAMLSAIQSIQSVK